MNRIAIHMPVYSRIEITRMAYHGLKRNIREFKDLGFVVNVFIAGDEEDHKKLAEEFGWIWCEANNKNLGIKNQKLYEFMKDYEWDWLLQLGSDDILLPGGAQCISGYMQKHEFACFSSIYMFQKHSGEGTLLHGYPCGAGRFISRKICDSVKTMWIHAVIGNDGRSADRIYRQWKIEPFRMDGVYIADIKSDVNVTPFFRHSDDMYYLKDIVPEHIHLKK